MFKRALNGLPPESAGWIIRNSHSVSWPVVGLRRAADRGALAVQWRQAPQEKESPGIGWLVTVGNF